MLSLKKESFLKIIESVQSDLRNTYEDIQKGKPYQLYFNDLLNAKYDLIKFMNEQGVIDWDLKQIIEHDNYMYDLNNEAK